MRTYANCLKMAERAWGEAWYKHCQITRTSFGRTKEVWIVQAVRPAMFALRRVS